MKGWMRFLKKAIGDEQQIEDLRLWIGAVLKGERPWKVLCLLGNDSLPKILVLELLYVLVGHEKCIEHFDLKNMQSTPGTTNLKDKCLIFSREYEAEDFIAILNSIKRLTSRDPVTCINENEEVETLKPTWSLALPIKDLPPLDEDRALDFRLLKIKMRKCCPAYSGTLLELTAKKKAELKAWALAS